MPVLFAALAKLCKSAKLKRSNSKAPPTIFVCWQEIPIQPYTALIELKFSAQTIEILDRQGQARRGRAGADVRFDSMPEILRAIGAYIDSKQGRLQRIDNSCPSSADDPIMTIEYQTRAGELQSENCTMSFMREASMRMYKRRARLSNPIGMVARKR